MFSDVDIKVDLSNLNVVEGTPSGSVKIEYGAFDPMAGDIYFVGLV